MLLQRYGAVKKKKEAVWRTGSQHSAGAGRDIGRLSGSGPIHGVRSLTPRCSIIETTVPLACDRIQRTVLHTEFEAASDHWMVELALWSQYRISDDIYKTCMAYIAYEIEVLQLFFRNRSATSIVNPEDQVCA